VKTVYRIALAFLLAGCTGGESVQIDQSQSGEDAGAPPVPPDAAEIVDAAEPDAPPVVSSVPTGAACASSSDCGDGVCIGAPGTPLEGNNRFAGGYCTTVGCTVDSQEGCGTDEWCIDGGDAGSICVAMCAGRSGLFCAREDHVCLGLGNFGGCFSRETVECTVVDKEGTGCPDGDLCIKIGFDDFSIGRCETPCDLMNPMCTEGRGCYFIRAYVLAFCGTPGTAELGEPCACDKCCVPGLACTRNDDAEGSTCRKTCLRSTGEGCVEGERCKALKKDPEGVPITDYGGCMPGL
jgi:hypothetical protein